MAVTITAAVLRTVISSGLHGNAHLLEKIGQTLRGEERLLAVAGAVQADHQAVADELVIAHAFERYQFLEPRGGAQRAQPAARSIRRKQIACSHDYLLERQYVHAAAGTK